jgi:hypothetical protein
MKRDIEELLNSEHPGLWVEIDVAMEAFGLAKSRAYDLAKAEGWRRARGVRPTQYAFADIKATYRRRVPGYETPDAKRLAALRERLVAKHLIPRR